MKKSAILMIFVSCCSCIHFMVLYSYFALITCRNNKIEDSLDTYKEAFDVVYLVSGNVW